MLSKAQVIVADHRWGSQFRYEGPRLHIGECVEMVLHLRSPGLSKGPLTVQGEVTSIMHTDKVVIYFTTRSPKADSLKGIT